MNTKIKKEMIPPQSVEHVVKVKNEIFDKNGRLQTQIRIELKKESK